MWANRISSIADTASVHIGHLSAHIDKGDTMNTMFRDRDDAGNQLAEALYDNYDIDTVIALPGGSLQVGRRVADRFDTDLYCLAVQPILAPFNTELAIGAVTRDGTHWLDENRIDELTVGDQYIEDGINTEQAHATERQELYGDTPALDGKTVALIDDGIETTAEVCTALKQLEDQGATVIVATPVMPQAFHDQLADEAIIVSLTTPDTFVSTAHHYQEFKPLPDDEAATYLGDPQ